MVLVHVKILPASETFVAKVNQKVVGFCTVVRGSEQNSLAEIYIIPAFQGKKIGRRLWDSARQFIDQNNDTTVALLRLNTPAKRFYEGLGFAETGVSWEGENLKNGGRRHSDRNDPAGLMGFHLPNNPPPSR